MLRWIRRAGGVLIAVFLFSLQPAFAHGYIVRAIPRDSAVLDRAPTRVQYWFSEDLEPTFSEINVRNSTGEIIATGGVDENDAALMTAHLPNSMPDGTYIVELRLAFASDGHVISENQVFFVGESASDFAQTESVSGVILLEVVWRVLIYSGVLLLFGVFALYVSVLLPAWGNPSHRAGLLPPRVMHRLNQIVIAALVIAFLGNILALLQQTMAFFGVDLMTALGRSFWDTVRTSTRFGDVWNFRILMLLLVIGLHAASYYWRERQPETVRAFWTANAWVAALVLGTLSVSSHAAGSLLIPWLALGVDWLHLVSISFWTGGLAALVLILPTALRPHSADQRQRVTVAALRQFSRLVIMCVGLVITTGIYSSLNWLYEPDDVTQTAYGNTLTLKVLLVGLLLVIGAVHQIASHPERYQRFETIAARISNLLPSLRLEVVIVCAVLVSVSFLSATPIPKPAFLENQTEVPNATQVLDGLTVNQTLSPGGTGVNSYETLLLRDNQPVEDIEVRLRVANPSRDWRGEWHNVEAAGGGLYVTAGDEIDLEGVWWMLIDITDENGEVQRFVFDWSVDASGGVIQSRSPELVHWLSLGAILAVLLWGAYPSVVSFAHWLDWRPTSVTIAIFSMATVILVIGVVVRVMQDSEVRYQESLNPPPQVVNTISPDAASLERGLQLYTDYCLDWQASPDFRVLRGSLTSIRDETIFNATINGWRDLPACTGDLNDSQRWDIVNFFRTFEE